MTIQDLMRKFVQGETKGKASSVSIEGNKLYSYSTVICYRDNIGSYVMNTDKYSRTTSRQQTWLRWALENEPLYYETDEANLMNYIALDTREIDADEFAKRRDELTLREII